MTNKIEILIVEDEESQAATLEEDLTELGYRVCGIAQTGKEGLALFYSKEPDLVVLDIKLKGEMNGIEVGGRISKDELCRKPIIFITVDNTIETFERAKIAKPFAYLLKPYDMFTLQHQIELAIHYFNYGNEGSHRESFRKGIFQKDYFYIKKMKRVVKVLYDEILYAEVESNYSTLVTATEKYTLLSSLTELQKKLPEDNFIRIHKNYIANLRAIKEFDFEEYTVNIVGKTLPIGKKFKSKITERIPMMR
ncbi:MAG: response regulator transcription factor [Ignavibacteria bacterium]|jgi:DNA-binding LytR/AlgR family response regulator